MSRQIAYWTDHKAVLDSRGELMSIPIRRCAWIQKITGDTCLIVMSRHLDPHCPVEDDDRKYTMSSGVWSLTP